MRLVFAAIILATVTLGQAQAWAEGEPSSPQIHFFEEKIRPVLAAKCYKCHSERARKIKGKLKLDSREAILKGGSEGPSVILGKPDESLMIIALRHQDGWDMPPEEKLPDAVVADFAKWIAEGAYFPTAVPAKADQDWWELVDSEKLLAKAKPLEQAVDHYVGAKIKADNVTPTAAADDSTFIRRVTLDLAGRIPTAAEVQAYAKSADPEKKAKLVDDLLGSGSFTRQQVAEFIWLINDGRDDGFRGYLEKAFADNRSWDKVFEEIILARSDTEAVKGAEKFYRNRIGDLDRLTNDVSVNFFGVNVSCAQCHDHPEVPSWKQDHYYGMKSFFNRTFENGNHIGEREYGLVSFKTTAGVEKKARLMFLSGSAIDEPTAKEPDQKTKEAQKKNFEQLKKENKPVPAPSFSRREQLVRVGLKPGQSGFFSRAIVNRLWHRFMGYGLVMPLDQMHGANPPSHPELLEWLARDFAGNDYDLRRTIRGLMLSDAYARDSQWPEGERPSPVYFAVARPRPLTPNQYGSALVFAAADPEQLANPKTPEDLVKRLADLEKRGENLAKHFDRPDDTFQVSVDEALYFSNSDQVQNDLLGEGGKLLGRVLKTEGLAKRLEVAFLNTLSREPSPEETETLNQYLAARNEDEKGAWQQVLWALMTSSEMRFNR